MILFIFYKNIFSSRKMEKKDFPNLKIISSTRHKEPSTFLKIKTFDFKTMSRQISTTSKDTNSPSPSSIQISQNIIYPKNTKKVCLNIIEKTKLPLKKRNTLAVKASQINKEKTRNKKIARQNTTSYNFQNNTENVSLPKITEPHFIEAQNLLEISFGIESPRKDFHKMQTYGVKTRKRLKIKCTDSKGNSSNHVISAFNTNHNTPVKKENSSNCLPQRTKEFFPHFHKGLKQYSRSKFSMRSTNPNSTSLSPSNILTNYPKYPSAKISSYPVGEFIRSYAVNSYQGLTHSYNEDKVSIILTISKPKDFEGEWPQCSFLGIYDGHGGSRCCDFLRDHLHHYIIKNKYFPKDPEKALLTAFERAERHFISQIALKENNKSGSCALVLLIVDNIAYIANCGDSRAIGSYNSGTSYVDLSIDHKPNNEKEKERIEANGGKIYVSPASERETYRVTPSSLSVSRTFGDMDAKLPKFGGSPGIIVSTPEIRKIEITNSLDFIIMGSDGIFEKLSSRKTVSCAWNTVNEMSKRYDSVHSLSGGVVDMIIKTALKRGTNDNVTCVFLSFKNFERKFNEGTYFLKGSDGCLDLRMKNNI